MTHDTGIDVARHERELADIARVLRETLESGTDPCRKLAERIETELAAHASGALLNIAFVGQYSAGKSTMISALTGRRDIRIDADIATGATTPYDWKRVCLVDTPGLYTERADHDEITREAIRKADLLVYCVTYMLFDDVTSADFRRLAFVDALAPKMMLVVNKMSGEAGEWQELVTNYLHSLEQALRPEGLRGIRVVFVDARDYLEGVDDDDEELVELSRFRDLVRGLNEFAAERGVLGRLDTPVRILRGGISDATVALTRGEHEDDRYLLLLQQMGRINRVARDRLWRGARTVSTDAYGEIVRVGQEFVSELQEVKSEEEADLARKRTEQRLEEVTRSHAERLEAHASEAANSLQAEVDEVLASKLAADFSAALDRRQLDPANLGRSSSTSQSWGTIKDLGTKGADSVFKFASGTKAVDGFLLGASNAAGSQLHQAVYGVGKLIGYNFRPWEAVNYAKFIGNAARVGGTVLSGLFFLADCYSHVKDLRAEQAQSDVRKTLANQFRQIAVEVELQFEKFLRDEVEPRLFGTVDRRLDEARRARLDELSQGKGTLATLSELDGRLQALVRDLATPRAPYSGSGPGTGTDVRGTTAGGGNR